jgi:branched-chain amino acid aminotransferase
MLNYNSTIFDDKAQILTVQNRAFRYGDGLFETMRLIKGEIPLFNWHFNRLINGMKALHFQIPSYFNIHYLKNEILKTVDYQKVNARIRLSVWRSGEGAYLPTAYTPEYLIQTNPIADPIFTLNEVGLTLGIFQEIRLYETKISCYKTANALPFVLAADFAKQEGLDDVFLLHTEGGVAEATASNVFVLKNNCWHTPPLSQGCVGGVMRNFILQKFQSKNIIFRETKLMRQDLIEGEEIFLTNAVQGIRWVGQLGEKTYEQEATQRLAQALQRWIKV